MSNEQPISTSAPSDNETIDFLLDRTRLLWLLALGLFGVGDIATTAVGLTTGWAIETGPLAAIAIAKLGLVSMIPLKLATFGMCYVMWRIAPDPYRVGVPLGLASLGFFVTAQNLLILALAAFSGT